MSFKNFPVYTFVSKAKRKRHFSTHVTQQKKKIQSNAISVTLMTVVKLWYHIYLKFCFCFFFYYFCSRKVLVKQGRDIQKWLNSGLFSVTLDICGLWKKKNIWSSQIMVLSISLRSLFNTIQSSAASSVQEIWDATNYEERQQKSAPFKSVSTELYWTAQGNLVQNYQQKWILISISPHEGCTGICYHH